MVLMDEKALGGMAINEITLPSHFVVDHQAKEKRRNQETHATNQDKAAKALRFSVNVSHGKLSFYWKCLEMPVY